jgi:large subunit ribosomal protein L15
MGTTLSTLAPNPGANPKKKRLGRGRGSGTGKTSGKGQKGQKARAGSHYVKPGFEGGQMPMQRRLPKRGFKNPFRVETYPINIDQLERLEVSDGTVDLVSLRKAGLIPKKAQLIKILGQGELTKPLKVVAHRFSASAQQKIEAAGGSVEVLATRTEATQG